MVQLASLVSLCSLLCSALFFFNGTRASPVQQAATEDSHSVALALAPRDIRGIRERRRHHHHPCIDRIEHEPPPFMAAATARSALYAVSESECYFTIPSPRGALPYPYSVLMTNRRGGRFSRRQLEEYRRNNWSVVPGKDGSDWVALPFLPLKTLEDTAGWKNALPFLYPDSPIQELDRQVQKCVRWVERSVYPLFFDFVPELLVGSETLVHHELEESYAGREIDFDAFLFSDDLKTIGIVKAAWRAGELSGRITSDETRFSKKDMYDQLAHYSQYPIIDSGTVVPTEAPFEETTETKETHRLREHQGVCYSVERERAWSRAHVGAYPDKSRKEKIKEKVHGHY